jgi:hypothetical protein
MAIALRSQSAIIAGPRPHRDEAVAIDGDGEDEPGEP